jgi:hypothetical protein
MTESKQDLQGYLSWHIHERGSVMYPTNPPQYKCRICGSLYMESVAAADNKKLSELRTNIAVEIGIVHRQSRLGGDMTISATDRIMEYIKTEQLALLHRLEAKAVLTAANKVKVVPLTAITAEIAALEGGKDE